MKPVSVKSIDAWQRLASSMFVAQQCRAVGVSFSARVVQRSISPSMWVSRVRFGAHHAERSRRLVDGDATDHLLVFLQVRGSLSLLQRGRETALAPGQLALCDASEPYCMDAATRGQDLIVLQTTREVAGLSDQVIAKTVSRPMDAAVPGQVALRALLYSLQSSELALDAHSGPSIAHVVGDALGVVVRALARGDGDDGQDRRERLRVLQCWLREHRSDPLVTVERLAAAHFLSVRQVHALFADVADSPAAFLRRVRLEHATELLSARGASSLTVRAVAEESGYRDSGAFIRAFAREFGCSPTQWRSPAALSSASSPAVLASPAAEMSAAGR